MTGQEIETQEMREKKIMRIYNWCRLILLLLFILFLYLGVRSAS